MTKEEAIKQLDGAEVMLMNREFKSFNQALIMAISALSDQEKRNKGCEYCREEKVLYQYTNTTKLYMSTFWKARTLEVECMPCPPYSDCSRNGFPALSAFRIKYCPECGRKLEVTK